MAIGVVCAVTAPADRASKATAETPAKVRFNHIGETCPFEPGGRALAAAACRITKGGKT